MFGRELRTLTNYTEIIKLRIVKQGLPSKLSRLVKTNKIVKDRQPSMGELD